MQRKVLFKYFPLLAPSRSSKLTKAKALRHDVEIYPLLSWFGFAWSIVVWQLEIVIQGWHVLTFPLPTASETIQLVCIKGTLLFRSGLNPGIPQKTITVSSIYLVTIKLCLLYVNIETSQGCLDFWPQRVRIHWQWSVVTWHYTFRKWNFNHCIQTLLQFKPMVIKGLSHCWNERLTRKDLRIYHFKIHSPCTKQLLVRISTLLKSSNQRKQTTNCTLGHLLFCNL